MRSTKIQSLTIAIPEVGKVSGLLQAPRGARACYVLAHGAGAGMTHPFLTAISAGLAERGIATLRYQFPSMERGSRRSDRPEVAHAAVRAAVAEARRRLRKQDLFAGGKSFGGRMTSQAQAASPLPGVRGLIFFGFPLHPAGKPSLERASHLAAIRVPLLFLQGTRDELAELTRLKAVCRTLGPRATLRLVQDADHSFHVPARTGRRDPDVQIELLDAVVDWLAKHAA